MSGLQRARDWHAQALRRWRKALRAVPNGMAEELTEMRCAFEELSAASRNHHFFERLEKMQ
jgi:hypothetical protein